MPTHYAWSRYKRRVIGLSEIPPQTWLTFSVVGAVVSTFGSLFGVLKDYLFSRSFEQWKQKQAMEQLYQKFRDPLSLAARELASRSMELVQDFPAEYLKESVFKSRPFRQLQTDFEDPYFLKYKLVSTIYRLSAFLAWVGSTAKK